MKPSHAAETLLARGLTSAARALPWRAALGVGAVLGATAGALGLRRRVAEANLALAFPERTPAERRALLEAHYREVGRIAVEYARLPELVRAPFGQVVAGIDGLAHLQSMAGRGAVLLTGHYGNFELLGAVLARMNPVDFVVKPLSNPGVEAMLVRLRQNAGVGLIPVGAGVKQVFRALRAGRWVALLADQDARRNGVFVPFFGRLASTPEGPARLALQTRSPIVFGTVRRGADGRHTLRVDPPHLPATEADEAGVLSLTAWHTARLEAVIREAPEHWFWLHRRWKTPPPGARDSATKG